MLVQDRTRYAGLHRGGEVFRVDHHNLIHTGQVQTDTALNRQEVPFQRGARTERDQRYMVFMAMTRHPGYFLCAASKDNHIRQHGWIRRLIPSMVFTHSVRKRATLLELHLQGFNETVR